MSEGDDVPPEPPERARSPRRSGSGIEVFKAILDFVSKCFYPAIVVAVIILLQPALSRIDLQGLLSRLQSAKAGGYEFTFNQAEDVGAATAPLNSRIADLKRELATLTLEVRALQTKTGATAPAAPAVTTQDRFEQNSRYTVLVFNSSKSRSRAEKITDALLNAGYKSSRTETDFAELGRNYPVGTVYVTHTRSAASAYAEIAKLITPLVGNDTELKVQKSPSDLRRGDVQILVF